MKKHVFTGAAVAIVTPFYEDNAVNYGKLGELIDFQIAGSADAIVVCGTTGESATLSDEEKRGVISYAVNHVAGRIPVIAGTGCNSTQRAAALTKFAADAGADASLQVTPYYNKTTQQGLINHFTYIADSTSLPMILYNVPGRTGMTVKPETYKILSEHENIVGVKEACGDISAIAKTRHLCGDALDLYSGDDISTVPVLSLGGKGVISVLSNIVPKVVHDICDLFFSGKTMQSAALSLQWADLTQALFNETNPIPVKSAMNMMGFGVGGVRMPLCEPSEETKVLLKKCLLLHGLIESQK